MCGEWVLYFLAAAGLACGAFGGAALLHEGGHALAGYLLRAKCLWIRVGRVLWIPGAGIFYRAARAGRAGECAMSCPDLKSLVAAALGGASMNFVTGAAAGLLCLLWRERFRQGAFGSVGVLLFSGTAAFCACSLWMAWVSLCPGMAGKENDGMMLKRLCREKAFYEKFRRSQQRDLLRLEFGLVEEMF